MVNFMIYLVIAASHCVRQSHQTDVSLYTTKH